MKRRGFHLLLLTVTVLTGCATIPTGPSVMVMPGPGKPFEVFRSEDNLCRQWASQQAGAGPSETTNQTLAGGAAIGAITGAAIGAAGSHHAGAGALVGAGVGLLAGTAIASGPAYAGGQSVQRRYDIAYQQCMYANGNNIPGVVRYPRNASRVPPPPPPGYGNIPPPPPGYGTMPPPDYRSATPPSPDYRNIPPPPPGYGTMPPPDYRSATPPPPPKAVPSPPLMPPSPSPQSQ
jgi:hypothetical protein